MNHALLADIYGGLGSLNSETNNFQGTYDCFMNEWEHLQAALPPYLSESPRAYLSRPGIALYAQGVVEVEQAKRLLRAGEAAKSDAKFDASLDSFTQALANFQKLLGTHRKTADTHYKVAGLLQRKRDYGKAV